MNLRRTMCVLVMGATAWPVMGGAQEKGNWRAQSHTAKTITGDVAFSGEKLAINFSAYWIAQIRLLEPAEASAVFGVESGDGGRGNLYRLSISGATKFLHKNTLCGGEDVQWAATYVVGRNLQMALFSGSHPPALTPEGMAGATDLCGTFAYVK
jgi:hypothetical protein